MKQLFNLYSGFTDMILSQSHIKKILFNQINISFDWNRIQTISKRIYMKAYRSNVHSGYDSIALSKIKLCVLYGQNGKDREMGTLSI